MQNCIWKKKPCIYIPFFKRSCIYILQTLIMKKKRENIKNRDDFDSYNLSWKSWLNTSVVLSLISFCLLKTMVFD